MWIQITFILSFHMPRDCSYLTFHYPFEALYKEPLGYIKGEELKSKKTIVHCCHSFLVLDSASLCPSKYFIFFPRFPFLVSLLSRDGGLRWWRPRWRNQFIWFANVPIEDVTCVIYDLINRNIFSHPMMCL